MQKEIWKPIKGYEGIYEVSSIGRVKSLDRYITQKNRWGCPMKRFLKGKILKPDKTRYHFVILRHNGKSLTQSIHRLVALAFIPNPENKPQVNHKNADKSDNRIENLEWCTHKENHEHADEMKLRRYGKDCHNSILVLDSYTGIFYNTVKELSIAMDVHYQTIMSRVLNKKCNRFVRL